MPPRVRSQFRSRLWREKGRCVAGTRNSFASPHEYATAAATTSSYATTPAPSISQMMASPVTSTTAGYPPSQPPSHRPPIYRKSQLLRSYVSLLRSTPLILLFQHNNLTAVEWSAIRRELASAIDKTDQSLRTSDVGGSQAAVGAGVKFQVVQTNILEPALRVAEYYRPPPPPPPSPPTPETPSQTGIPSPKEDPTLTLTHSLSESAYEAVLKKKGKHPLAPLLNGALALLTIPTVSPPHLRAALQVLAPKPPRFPAPRRKANPSYWDPAVQDGVKKLMLLGARIEGRVLDTDQTMWVGGIDDGGVDALRAQLVHVLQGVGVGVAGALEGAGRSLYLGLESRRRMMMQQQEEKKEGGKEELKVEPKSEEKEVEEKGIHV